MSLPRARFLTAALVCLPLVLTACARSEDSDTGGGTGAGSGGGEQVVATPSGGAAGPGCTLEAYGAPKLDLKTAVVGFSQSEKEANPFRIAETQSMRDEAAKLGVKKLLVTNANSQLSKQISDIQDMINQGAQALVVAPLNSDGLEPALNAAKAKKIPVLTIDRKINAKACDTYLAFLGSNFVEQGKRAAEWLIKQTGGKAGIVELTGTPGASVARDRSVGFMEEIKKHPDMKVIATQTGDFSRAQGQKVMENIIQAMGAEITAVYAHNDEMALGAIQAIRAFGLRPGSDVILVSIDGERAALESILRGELGASIESNPRFGPLAFDTLERHLAGQPVEPRILLTDRLFDAGNARDFIHLAY